MNITTAYTQMMNSSISTNKLKEHPLFPFSDFRTNDASFLLLEQFWTQVAREALGDELSSKVVALQTSERDIECDYNPVMLDFMIPEQNRGARILLRENFADQIPLSMANGDERFSAYYPFAAYWQNRGVTSPNGEIKQIVLSSDLSDEAIKNVQNALRAFLINQISMEQTDKEIDTYFANLPNFPRRTEWDEYYDRLHRDDDISEN